MTTPVNTVKGYRSMKDGERFFEGDLPWHCSRLLREHWHVWPCPDDAVKIYALPDGSRVGWCFRHLEEGKKHAEFRGWREAAA